MYSLLLFNSMVYPGLYENTKIQYFSRPRIFLKNSWPFQGFPNLYVPSAKPKIPKPGFCSTT